MLSLKILESLVNLGNGRIKAPVLKCNSSDAFIYNEPKIVQKPFKDCFTRSRSRVSKAANRSNKNLNDERKRARPQNILWDLGKIFEILVKSYGFSREGKKFHQWLYNRGVFAANMCFWPLSTRKRSLNAQITLKQLPHVYFKFFKYFYACFGYIDYNKSCFFYSCINLTISSKFFALRVSQGINDVSCMRYEVRF
jgi:hypothetical protein